MAVDGSRSVSNPEIFQAENGLYHVGRPRCALAEHTMADRDVKRISRRFVAHRAAEATTLVHGHAYLLGSTRKHRPRCLRKRLPASRQNFRYALFKSISGWRGDIWNLIRSSRAIMSRSC